MVALIASGRPSIPPLMPISRDSQVCATPPQSLLAVFAVQLWSPRGTSSRYPAARMRHCAHVSCKRIASYNVEGIKTAAYCRQHAGDSMVNVHSPRCSHESCTRVPSFNVEGIKTAAYCRHHAGDGMVNVHSPRCSHESCTRVPGFNVCLLYTSPSPRDGLLSRMPSSA